MNLGRRVKIRRGCWWSREIDFDGTVEDIDCGTCHEDMVGGLVPAEHQIAAGKVIEDGPIGTFGQDSRDANCRGAGTAGPGFPGSTFPGPLSDFASSENFDEFDIGSFWESRIVFDHRTDAKDQFVVQFGNEDHAVWVTHRDAGSVECVAFVFQFMVDDRLVGRSQVGRDLASEQSWLAHIDGDLIDHTLGDFEVQIENTGTGFDFELGFRGDFGIMHELGNTSDPVATHFRFAAVGIEHAHFGIGDRGREDQDDSIATDSEASVGQFNGQPLEIFGEGLREALDVDVVVTSAVHFREREFHHVNPLFDLWESESHWRDIMLSSYKDS